MKHMYPKIFSSKTKHPNTHFEEAYKLRRHLRLPFKISSLLSLQEQIIRQVEYSTGFSSIFSDDNLEAFNIDPLIRKAFTSLSAEEKVQHYTRTVNCLTDLIKNGSRELIGSPRAPAPIQEFKTYHKTKLLRWEKQKLLVYPDTRKIVVSDLKGHQQMLTLDYYWLRESRETSKMTLVLQPISASAEQGQVRLSFQQQKYSAAKQLLQDLMWQAVKEQLWSDLNAQSATASSQGATSLEKISSTKTIDTNDEQVSAKDVEVFYMFQRQIKILDESGLPKIEKKQCVWRGSSKKIYSLANQEGYYMEQIFMSDALTVLKGLRVSMEKWNSVVKQAVVFNKPELFEGCKVQYARFSASDIVFDIVFLKSQTSHKIQKQNQELKIYSVTLHSTKVSSFGVPVQVQPSFIHFELHQFAQDITKLYVRTRFDLDRLSQQALHNLHLSILQDTCHLLEASEKYSQSCDITQDKGSIGSGSSGEVDKTIYQSIMQFMSGKQNISDDLDDLLEKETQSAKSYKPEMVIPRVSQKYQLVPTINYERKIDTKHFLFDHEWVRTKNGGVRCLDNTAINEQKKLAKHIFGSIGSNIIRNKGLFNICLPVTIFKRESHLQSIANTFLYAPILLEKSASSDPLERSKLNVIFLLTTGINSICIMKPFNPVLGQTFQSFIDGCPIYLEQISHHPPISSFLVYGRKYRYKGTIGLRAELGMNVIRGGSDSIKQIQYEDGSVVDIKYMPLLIKGIIFGDRQFLFQGKGKNTPLQIPFVFDKTNLIFAGLSFGPPSRSYFSKSQQPQDYVYGSIYRVTQDFLQAYNNKTIQYPLSQHIVEELSTFKGIWTQKLYFDGKCYFDFSKDMSCVLEKEKNPLPSDCIWRQDLKKLLENKISESQAEKQRMEEQQRRDRKLRETHAKNRAH